MTNEQNNIDRREAIKKLGKYAAFTALGTMIILNPKKAQAQSGGTCTGRPNGFGGRRKKQSIFK